MVDASDNQDGGGVPSPRKTASSKAGVFGKRILIFIPSLILLWFIGDFTHSRIMKRSLQKWESAQTRDENGILEGCDAFTVGDGDVDLLMIHGFADAPLLYRKIANGLAVKGYRCRAMRLPGHAEPMSAYRTSSVPAWVATVDEEIRQLKRKDKPLYIVAHSMGAALTLRCLQDQADVVDGLVFIAPLFEVSRKRSLLIPPQTGFKWARRALFFTDMTKTIYSVDAHNPGVQEKYIRQYHRPFTQFEALFELMDQVKDISPESLEKPLLMFLSRTDRVVDYRAAEQFFNQAGSKPKQLIFMPDAGHVIPWDNDWTKVVDHIDRFVRRSD